MVLFKRIETNADNGLFIFLGLYVWSRERKKLSAIFYFLQIKLAQHNRIREVLLSACFRGSYEIRGSKQIS